MDGLQARLHTFKKSKRVKNPNKPSSTISLKWPHPLHFIANPASLADAGFYYDPSYDDPDNVTCFNCEKQLAGWEEDDDPYLIHWNKCAHSCCWAVVQCGLRADMDRSGRFVFPDKTRLPNQKTMEKARLETFTLGKGWVHDKTRNHSANSKSMARAGFAYTPHETGDDLASCLYCNVSLSGWDDDDDPMEEHRKRASKSDTNCPFFEHTESRPTPAPSTKPPSKSTSKPPSRTTSRSKYQDTLMPTKTFDSELEDESDIPSNSKSTTLGLGAKTPTKPRSRSRKSSAKTPGPGTKSRSVSRSGLKGVAEEVEDDEKATEPPPTVKKKIRSASKSVAKPEVLTQSDVEEEPAEAPPTIKAKSRTRSKSVAPKSETMVQSDGEDEVTTTFRKPTRSRAKSKAPVEVEKGEEEEPIRKSSRSKSKVATDPKVVPPRKTSRKGSKPKVVQEEVDTAESVAHSALDAKRTTTSHKRTGSRPKSPEVDSNVEQAVVAAVSTTKETKNAKSKPRSDAMDLFNDDIVPVDEYVPPPSPTLTQQSTTNELSPLFVSKGTKDKGDIPASGPLKDSEATSAPDKEAGKEKRKPGRQPKAKATSKDKPKQATKVVEVSSDEEEVERSDRRNSFETKAQTLEPVELAGPSTLAAVGSLKDAEEHSLGKLQPIEDIMDVSMHDVEPGIPETVTDTEQELHTAPSTPPKPIPREEDPNYTSRSDAPQSILHTSDDKSAEPQPSAPSANTTLLPLTTEPLYLPPLSRLPFMPLQTLSEAELDMTVEEWIRYQIEVEQDRFKRDGERELETFKKRAEEVRKAIEGL